MTTSIGTRRIHDKGIEYDELKRLATDLPAPWVTDADEPNVWHPKIRYAGDDGAFCGPIAELYSNLNLAASDPRMHLQMKQMAKFIAAANPAAVLELIAEVDRLAAENERFRAAVNTRLPGRSFSAVGTGTLHAEQSYCYRKGWKEGVAALRKQLRAATQETSK